MTTPFQMEFEFDTLVSTNAAPTAKMVLWRIQRIDHGLIAIETSTDCEDFPNVWKTTVYIGIAEDGRPSVEVMVSKPDKDGKDYTKDAISRRIFGVDINADGSTSECSS